MLTNDNQLLQPEGERNFKVITLDGETVYYPKTATPNDVMNDEQNDDGIDIVATLCLYYDPQYITDNEFSMAGDSHIFDRTFEELVKDNNLYEYGAKNHWTNDPRVIAKQ